MARNKQNVELFGKSWNPSDIAKLEKVIKLYERLNYLQTHFANSLSGASAIMAQINETTKIQEDLKQLNIKHTEEECRQIVNLLHAQQRLNRELKLTADANGAISYSYFNNNNAGVSRPSYSLSTARLSNAGQSYQDLRQTKQLLSNYNQAVQIEMDKIRTKLTASGKQMSDTDLKALVEENIKKGNYSTESAKLLSRSAGDFSKGASVIQIAADTFSQAVKTFGGLFINGLNAQKNEYNSNFTNIAVRSGASRSAYFSNQINTASQLSSEGLYNNIAVSDVMAMWNKLAETGLNQEDMFRSALDDVITQKLVPYLDVSSTSVQLLDQRLDGTFIKQIRGISNASLDLAGNNFATQDMLQTIIDQVQPMSDEAVQNLALGSTEVVSLINYLMSEEGGGLSKDQATSYATMLFKQQQYSDQIMSSGSVYEKMALMNNLDTNIYDSKNFGQAILNNINTSKFLSSLLPGDTSTMMGLISNVGGRSLGMSYSDWKGGQKANLSGWSGLSESQMLQYANEAYNSLANDELQTAANMQETYMANISTYVSAIYEQIGYWGDVISALIKSIAGVVGAKILGNIGSKFLGGSLGRKLV